MKYALAILISLGVISAAAQEASPPRLTLAQAQEIALKMHPAISVAALTALAAQQNVKAVHSAMLPSIFGQATAVGAADPNNTRIAAGGLNNPLIYSRQADGAIVSQLITDFGRTPALTESARAQQRAADMNTQAARAQILLEVNNAYFSALDSQAILQVAQETLQARQKVLEQIEEMATNKLKSALDVSFVRVDYDQASILLAKARSDLRGSFATLSAALGEPRPTEFTLVDEPMTPYATNNFSELLSEALGQRPDLVQSRYQRDAAQQMAKAESRLAYPTVNAIGAAGLIPAGNSHLSDDYAAAGIDLTIPLYTGGLDSARRREAEFRADAANEAVRNREDDIARDVQIAALNLQYAYERVGLTDRLLANANEALTLAQARLEVGSASIIELSQAELNKTSAQIDNASARYDYQTQRSALDFTLGRLR